LNDTYFSQPNVAYRAWAVRVNSDPAQFRPAFVAMFAKLADDASPIVRRELASAAIRLADKHDVTPLVRALLAHKEDAKDPVIPQLVWLAYEKSLTKKADASPASKELAWLAEQSPDNAFVREQIVPKVM